MVRRTISILFLSGGGVPSFSPTTPPFGHLSSREEGNGDTPNINSYADKLSFIRFCVIITIPQPLADSHGAEVRSAHRTVLPVQMVCFLVILQGTFRIQTQIKLVFPAELVAGFTQGIVPDLRTRMAFGKIRSMCSYFISDHSYTDIFFEAERDVLSGLHSKALLFRTNRFVLRRWHL